MNSYKKPVVFFTADGADAGGAQPQLETPPSQPPAKPVDVDSVVQKTIQSVLNSQRVGGDTSAALEVLAAKALKEEKRAQEAEAKIGQLPDDVKAQLEAYKSFGTVEELTAKIANAVTLETEKTQRILTDDFRKAATASGYDADALMEVIGQVPQTVIETVKKDGKDTQIAKVLLEDGADGKSFEDSMKERFPTIHESLKANVKPKVIAPVMGVDNGAQQQMPVHKPAGYRM